MTTPSGDIEVECPVCGNCFVTRAPSVKLSPSVNLPLGEKWTKKELDELRFVNCPRCDCRLEKKLIIGKMDPYK